MTPPPIGLLDRLKLWAVLRDKLILSAGVPVILMTGAMVYRYLVIDDVRVRVATVELLTANSRADITDLLTFDCLKTPADTLRSKGLFHMIARCQDLLAGR